VRKRETIKKAIYETSYNTPMTRAQARLVTTLRICQEFQGWTMEYVQGLSRTKRAEILGYIDGMNALRDKQARSLQGRYQ